MPVAGWYHCSLQTISRSAGRSVVAAAAYRLGVELHDERYNETHDYTRKRGIENTFGVAPEGCEWALNPERLFNAAETAETRVNSTVGREINLALPSFLSPNERRAMMQEFADWMTERYGVAIFVAIHEPGREGDDRNYHAHILFTTREVKPDGMGKKTRILDDRKTGKKETLAIREHAAEIINAQLAAVHSDIRVDHRSFAERGIDREPTKHLGPAASGMERRGDPSELGDFNRHVEEYNAYTQQRERLETAIEREEAKLAAAPREPGDERERVDIEAEPFRQAVGAHGAVADMRSGDGLKWWQRLGITLAEKARGLKNLALDLATPLNYWRDKLRERDYEKERREPGREPERGYDR